MVEPEHTVNLLSLRGHRGSSLLTNKKPTTLSQRFECDMQLGNAESPGFLESLYLRLLES